MTGNFKEKLAAGTLGSPSDKPRTSVQSLYLLAVLGTLMAFASLSTDVYLPAMPAMRHALHSGPGVIELTVSGHLIVFSLGQLVWGPIGGPLRQTHANRGGHGPVRDRLGGLRDLRQRLAIDRLAGSAIGGGVRRRGARSRHGPRSV